MCWLCRSVLARFMGRTVVRFCFVVSACGYVGPVVPAVQRDAHICVPSHVLQIPV